MNLTEEPRLLTNDVHSDSRGWFMESYNEQREGLFASWCQDNLSFSKAGTIRGIHYQLDGQRKLVRCVSGSIIDIVVDLRKNSPNFGRYQGFNLTERAEFMLYVPSGFGHSFLATQDSHVLYKVDSYWNRFYERGINYEDPHIDIPWRAWHHGDLIVSDKDKGLPLLEDAETFD